MIDRRFTTALGSPWKYGLLIYVLVVTLALVFMQDPLPQDPGYHHFADRRSIFGVPNVLDTLSSLSFVFAGLVGFRYCRRDAGMKTRTAWTLFFAAVILVGGGSGFYHLYPADETLVWDRLPMALAFMALFAALAGQYLGGSSETWLLGPSLLLGAASVLVWHASGDLRLYVWVQLTALMLVPVKIVFSGRGRKQHLYLLSVPVFYLLSRYAELADPEIYRWTQETISGHTLKHLLAALSIGLIPGCWLKQASQAESNPYAPKVSCR